MATKTEEIDNKPSESYIMVFNINGTVYLDEQQIPYPYKVEGLDFYQFVNSTVK